MSPRQSFLAGVLVLATALSTTLVPGLASGQPMGGPPPEAIAGLGGPPGGGRMPFMEQLFLPAMVMRNQEAIHLSDEQRQAIQEAMVRTQAKLVDLQWQLDAQQEKLTAALSPARVDEPAALAQVDRVMVLEQQVKKLNLELLIAIKNQLTATQQEALRKLRPPRGGGGPPWMRGGGPGE